MENKTVVIQQSCTNTQPDLAPQTCMSKYHLYFASIIALSWAANIFVSGLQMTVSHENIIIPFYLIHVIPLRVSSTTSTTRSICCTPTTLSPRKKSVFGAPWGTQPATTTALPFFRPASTSFLRTEMFYSSEALIMSNSHHSGKVKMSLCWIWHLAMKACGRTVLWLHALLTQDGVTSQITLRKVICIFYRKVICIFFNFLTCILHSLYFLTRKFRKDIDSVYLKWSSAGFLTVQLLRSHKSASSLLSEIIN